MDQGPAQQGLPIHRVRVVNKREQRYITKALVASLGSSYKRIRIGAVLVDGNYIVAAASNRGTSHPRQRKYNERAGRIAPAHALHAEIHALVKSKNYDLTGTEVFVARLDRTGAMAMCRPCKACRLALSDAGVSTAIYTTPQGIIRERLTP